jgi:hypothetical protein
VIAPRLALVAAVALAVVTLGACTSSGTPNAITPPPSSSTLDTPTDSASPTDTAPSSDPATATDTSTATATPTGPASTPTAAHPVSNECGFAQLRIQAVRGSASQGSEFAQIVFTNRGPSSCTMQGFPGVSLRRNGALLGKPAARDNSTAKAVTLKAGQSATSDVLDFSTCQASLSDTVRVYPPDSLSFTDLPLDLRGCSLSVKPVVPQA